MQGDSDPAALRAEWVTMDDGRGVWVRELEGWEMAQTARAFYPAGYESRAQESGVDRFIRLARLCCFSGAAPDAAPVFAARPEAVLECSLGEQQRLLAALAQVHGVAPTDMPGAPLLPESP